MYVDKETVWKTEPYERWRHYILNRAINQPLSQALSLLLPRERASERGWQWIYSECFLFVCFAGDNISDYCSSFPVFLLQVPIWPSVLLPLCYIRGKYCFERGLGQHWGACTPLNRNYKMGFLHVFRTVCVGHEVQPRLYTSVVAWYCFQCVAMC